MKIITILLGLFLCLSILFVGGRWFVRYKSRQRKEEEARKAAELEQKLRKMSDLDLKIWMAGLRKNLYSEDYNSSEMRQVIEKEIRRRRFVPSSLYSLKV